MEWLASNIRGVGGFDNTREIWITRFSVLCWLLWKNRYSSVLDPNFVQKSDLVHVSHHLSVEYVMAFSTRSSGLSARPPHVVRWQCPPVRWIKANSDGAMHPSSGKAVAGGVLRDERETDNQEVARILCRDSDALADNALVDSLHGLLSCQ
ncbi:hypothetical protein V6N12_069758 [Hibiscus sabdariffa]|uniref:Uncharacterized protein n=1 Tax=Hibiscus sabdariffa TaxID=183260 RepID=A0ABR2FES2_9ROSI